MLTLAIETSGRGGSIALSRDGEFLDEADLAATGRRHARTLVPEIRTLLRKHQLSPNELNLLAVSIGPGSFTGLRVGVVCAKTMAYALGCSLIGIDTFLAVAAGHPDLSGPVHVIDDALRGDVCAGEYVYEEGQWKTVNAPRLVAFDVWKESLPSNALVSGPGLSQWADELQDFRLADPDHRHPQARFVCHLGDLAARAGLSSDPWTLEPFYMRRSAAEEKANAQAQARE